MKIVLVVTDSGGKSFGFVSDTMQVFSMEEVSRLISTGKLVGVHIVQSQYGVYARSMPNIDSEDNLDSMSVSGREIVSFANQTRHSISTPPISAYMERYLASLKEGRPFLVPVGQEKVLVADIKSVFSPHHSLVITAAREFNVNASLLGAILIDELARMQPFEDLIDALGAKIIGRDVSVGVMQVKIDTAHQLIKKGLYHPNPADKELPYKGALSNVERAHVYEYLIQPKHNIRFGAARMRDLIDEWMKVVDISQRSEIIATLYSLPYRKPHAKPEANERGNQIATEFYKLAKKWLA
ncbi:DUF1402 family protein [Candidatus Kaiserbacteria bacterium]|nr:DUF1402 family protein [Candidatus Kaiserbacteria bacterium]